MPSKKVSGTKEWAASNENVSVGCSNRCKYCYAHAMAARFGRVPEGGWGNMQERPGIWEKGYGKRKGRIMFPTTHDIVPANRDLCIHALQGMLRAGNEVLVVSKPQPEAILWLIEDLKPWRDQILFRFTIGSGDDRTLSFWEPGAPTFTQRLAALERAHNAGFATSVSMEPLLEMDEEATVNLVRLLAFTVTDAIWIGKANRLYERLMKNGHWEKPGVRQAARDLMDSQSDERIRSLYERLRTSKKVRWKESIKKVVGLDVPTLPGLDI